MHRCTLLILLEVCWGRGSEIRNLQFQYPNWQDLLDFTIRSRITKYIISPSALNILSVLDHDSTVVRRHVSVFRIST
jgi:hypothetical protein